MDRGVNRAAFTTALRKGLARMGEKSIEVRIAMQGFQVRALQIQRLYQSRR